MIIQHLSWWLLRWWLLSQASSFALTPSAAHLFCPERSRLHSYLVLILTEKLKQLWFDHDRQHFDTAMGQF